MSSRLARIGLAAVVGVAAACGAVHRPAELRRVLDQRSPEQGERLLDAVLTDSSTGRVEESGRDTGRLLLERGSIRLSLGEFSGCVGDFARADRLLDHQAMLRSRYLTGGYNPKSTVYMYERGWNQAANLPYGPKFYERLLINPLGALCRLELLDESGACAEMRRFGVMSDWTERVAGGRAIPVRAFGELVTTLSCANVAPQLSCSAFRRAQALAPKPASHAGVACGRAAPDTARFWLFVAYGRPSHPVTPPDKPQEVSLVSGEATRAEPVVVRVDGRGVEAPEVLDVDAAVRADYRDGQHAMRVTFMGQTAWVGGWSDTAWETLPAHIHLAALGLSPGTHDVEVTLRGESRRRSFELAAGATRAAVIFAPF